MGRGLGRSSTVGSAMLLLKTKQNKNHNTTTFQIISQHLFTWLIPAHSLAMFFRALTASARASHICFAVNKTCVSADAGSSGILTEFVWWLKALFWRGRVAKAS